jgi:hypothetical protein
MKTPLPSPDQLRKLIEYDPISGILTWRERPVVLFSKGRRSAAWSAAVWNAKHANKPALSQKTSHGYMRGNVTVDGVTKSILAHRAAWAIYHGCWPGPIMDHEDNDGCNNRIANLRDATTHQNARNCTSARGSSSQYLGVFNDRVKNRWTASITVEGKQIWLGGFNDERAAAIAYDTAAREYFGDFANPNFP